jgi:hypothetical protein
MAVLAFASVSGAQTSGQVFTRNDSKACMPHENRRAKKQQELVEIQARMTRLQGAVAAFEEGILLQQAVGNDGQWDAMKAGGAAFAKVTKAMSDTFLELTQDYSPQTRVVKKAYDAFDALVGAGTGLYEGNGVKTTEKGLDTVQKGTEAYIQYLRVQDPLAILPQKPRTPGVLGSAVKSADDLRRGDLAGSASNVASGVEKLLDSKAMKRGSRAASKMLSGIADTPGKTADSRVADELTALGEVSKLAANAAHTRGTGELAAMAGRSGRLLGYSGVMLEQVSRAKQGLGETADMYREYKRIEERSAKTQEQFQRQIAQKAREIARLEGDAQRVIGEIRDAEAKILSCRIADETRLAKANGSTRSKPATRASSYERLDRTSWRAGSPYAGSSWDRRASQQRRERVIALRNLAEERRRRTIATDGYSSPGPNYGTSYPSAAPNPQTDRPLPPPAQADECAPSAGTSTGTELCYRYPKETVSRD